MADITPLLPVGRQIIHSYGGGGFRIAGQAYDGSVLVFPETTLPWPIASAAEMTIESFTAVTTASAVPRILLIGCGERILPLAPDIRHALSAHGVSAEVMDTGAACRTFNVLLAEDRAVAAALVAVP